MIGPARGCNKDRDESVSCNTFRRKTTALPSAGHKTLLTFDKVDGKNAAAEGGRAKADLDFTIILFDKFGHCSGPEPLAYHVPCHEINPSHILLTGGRVWM